MRHLDKKQTAVILEVIATMYQNKFKVDNRQLLLDLWFDTLKDYDFETISENLKVYYKTNKFPPSVADLIHATERRDRALPTIEETNQLLLGYEQAKEEKADPEQAEAALAKMRKLLKIERG